MNAGKIPGLASTIPLVFQDKIFVSQDTLDLDPNWAATARADCQVDGSLYYSTTYHRADLNPNLPSSAPPLPVPSCVPEFFGDVILCNGTAYPLLTIEAKRYRFLVLNGCNARLFNLNLFEVSRASAEGIRLNPITRFPRNPAGPKMIQIGTEGGFLWQDVTYISPKAYNRITANGNLIRSPAERADLIIDFTGMAGKDFILYNDASAPYPDGPPDTDFFFESEDNPVQLKPGYGPDTRQLLRIRVVSAKTPDPQPSGPILNPALVDPAPIVPFVTNVTPIPPLEIPEGVPVRDISLNEDYDDFGRLIQRIGTLVPLVAGGGLARTYLDSLTEKPIAGSVEVWRLWNLTGDNHPIHFHLVNVQILQRQEFTGDAVDTELTLTEGTESGPEPNELGWRETVKCPPGEITTVIMKFDLPQVPFQVPTSPRLTALDLNDPAKTYNEYVFHCHILEHEEHDMMRPLAVESPLLLLVTLGAGPYTASIRSQLGGTVTFRVVNGTAPFGVVSSDPTNFPVAMNPDGKGFAVTIQSGLATGTAATLTLTDAASATAQITINIVA